MAASSTGVKVVDVHPPNVLNGNGTPVKSHVQVNGNHDGASKRIFELEEHPVDNVRPIKVGIIGAGLAGITAGVLLPAKVPGLDLRIYDKNADAVRVLLSSYSY